AASPAQGIHEGIAVFDFQALYPSIVITHNVSPETVDCLCCPEPEKRPNAVPGSEHFFCARHRGFVTSVIEGLVAKRMALKKQLAALDPASAAHRQAQNRQYALKILANASYGYYGYAGSRWYSRVCAESITAFGRDYIQKVIAFAGKSGLRVLYGDTDSLFVQMDSTAITGFLDQVNAALPGVMELEYKEYYKSGIFTVTKEGAAAKKRYALLDFANRIVIRGFERVRRDWSVVAKQLQEEILLAVLRDKSVPRAVSLAREAIARLRSGSVPLEDLVIHTQLTKPLSAYKQVGPHVVAAQKLAKAGRPVYEGMTVSYVIAKGAGSIASRAEPLEQAQSYDPDYYVNNQVVPVALRVLSGLGVTEEQLTGGGQRTLGGFAKRKRRK
ncbi:MAG TPA: DNA polymerase domain-containing protein, partial [archaeon]|nr:DNA polymerase domain-containing protein [archaeon]